MSKADQFPTVPEEEGQSLDPSGQALASAPPSHIGRYRLERLLGKGGFGCVYLARDDQLQRWVAVKMPHPHLVSRPEDADAYLAEARTVASLDHPHIVPVFDIGSTETCPCFFVSKYIEGSNLAKRIKDDRTSPYRAAQLVATIAESLHYAHRRGLVHRDIKPGNILLDADGQPHVVDFGLALREEHVGHGPRYAGTPAYMSPEQARGEGHRVDGRSDLFSLGVVFYELLTGRRPFHADSREELLEQIATREARPPRQWDDAIPKELERICLKALSKRATERYPTAKDMADDLRHFLEQAREYEKSRRDPRIPATGIPFPAPTSTSVPSPLPTPSSGSQTPEIVPKGLRSFDAHDADFFLELLPGPRDREGLPDSIRFWKNRVEETDADKTFSVGLIYGPSGCGKSSLVKAGLLPRLAEHILGVYVEATAAETESRLLKGLRKASPELANDLDLAQTLTALRQGQGLAPGQKALLVLDQFEQWLHARKEGATTELVQALRQCDGRRVQCLLLVRDDFWLAASRFMGDLEVELVQGRNLALVDLFDLRHARKVLTAFGRAFGALAAQNRRLTREQDAFVDEVVSGLAQDGKVIPVRLALFAEMVKGKAWTPATLRAVGGTEGVGAAFLEESFVAATAPPQYRLHQRAAQAVLRTLLPASGSDIRGTMRSRDELLAASGYAAHPKEFEALLRILDGELRLLTPTDPEGLDDGGRQPLPVAGGRYYQLTHDYLVPSLRDWLTRKQKETRRGRAELLLEDRAAEWNARPENRQLPSLLQWLHLRCLTRSKDWGPPQRKMMRQATRYHLVRTLLASAILLLLARAGLEGYGRLQAQHLRNRLLEATTADVPGIVEDMTAYRRWVDPLLRETNARSADDSRQKLHTSLALVPVDAGQVDYLFDRLLEASATDVMVLRGALRPHQAELSERLWSILQDPQADPDRRLRAACALAAYTPQDLRWDQVSGDVGARLVIQNSLVIGKWAEALRPVGKFLLPPLASFLGDERHNGSEGKAIALLYRRFAEGLPDAFTRLESVLEERGRADSAVEERISLAKRRANIGVALVFLGRGDKVWPLLAHSPDPTTRSYLIERLGKLDDPRRLVERLDGKKASRGRNKEPEVSVRRALILALGGFGPDWLPQAERDRLLPRLQRLYGEDPDPGVHAAAEWLMRTWGEADKRTGVNERLPADWKEGGRRWFVNGLGQTFVVVTGPAEFRMGGGTQRHQQRIPGSFAIASKEVTEEDFLRFLQSVGGRRDAERSHPTAGSPVKGVSWYEAAHYCNWLSEREGVPREEWCYLPTKDGAYTAGMRLAPDRLRKRGYRLPTEAEWEFACRAGAGTEWACGDVDKELLGRYARWYGNSYSNRVNKPSPVGTLKPNDWGLFDMHGNVSEWCQDRFENAGGAGENRGEGEAGGVRDEEHRAVRGGSYTAHFGDVASAFRFGVSPKFSSSGIGFRPVKTLP